MDTPDPEIAALSSISSALDGLDPEAQTRILNWAAQRYDVAPSGAGQQRRASRGAAGSTSEGVGDSNGAHQEYAAFVDLFDASNAKSEADRALIGGYWFQELKGEPTFQAQQVNNELKELGQGASNITDALGALEGKKPAQIRQVGKSGRTKQARKTYKLTAAGVNAAKAMVARNPGGDEG